MIAEVVDRVRHHGERLSTPYREPTRHTCRVCRRVVLYDEEIALSSLPQTWAAGVLFPANPTWREIVSLRGGEVVK